MIEWAISAQNDLLEILAYFAVNQDLETGQKIVNRLLTAVRRLESFPLSGKAGRIPETREIVLAELPYVLVYHAGPNQVTILYVVHTARGWPKN